MSHCFRTISPAAGPDAITFQPGSDKALLNHYTTVNSFRGSLYSINSHIAAGQAVNIGRYKEDVYYNGELLCLVQSFLGMDSSHPVSQATRGI
jgi:hypothetical protein